MPVYEYECKTCEKVFEVQQKMSDAPLKDCPDCGAPINKLMSMSSFQLKGGGWYADGYSSVSNSSKSSSSSCSAADSGSGCSGCPASA
ncbi:MAG: transcriptional regulator [Desulfobacterales bacterium]|nr:MAG: transcriptional regulator [Desulfobacterales bacterium]